MLAIEIPAWQRRMTAIALLAGFVPVAIVTYLWLKKGIEPSFFTRDFAALYHVSPLSSGLSQLGGLGWASAFGVWIATAFSCRTVEDRIFAALSAGSTGFLCIDDIFMGHEFLVPRLTGIHENGVMVGIVLFYLAYFGIYWRRFIQTMLLSVGSVGFLALSMLGDELENFDVFAGDGWGQLAEDGPKFIGIVFWLALAIAQHLLIRDRTVH